jgi:predicted ATPase/DNA-binding CsgD family transcriptional regulator
VIYPFTIGFVQIEMGLTNFPVQLTSFIGREREIADVKRLLFSSHLVTLTGAGGSGKTRLAIQIADSMSETFADGVWLVDLAPLREPTLVPQLAAQALGLRPVADQPLLESLLRFVQSKQMLIILDNCEHLSEACAQLAQELLSQAPALRILATSREALGIAGEVIYLVSGLEWPVFGGEATRDEQSRLDLQELMGYDAVRLFVERARANSPNFSLTFENAWSTVETCRRLDGLPLALELASARINVLTVQEIVTRLNDRFALLISAQRPGIESRHQTLRAAIDWSYVLLSMDEQVLLRRLAVFEAGYTLDTVEAICTGEGIVKGNLLDMISSLVSKSLVVADTIGRAQARYRLLDSIREYALEKLDEAGETRQLRDCHLDLFLARAEEAAPKLGEAYQQLWLNWLESEHDNLRTALTWSLESGRVEEGLRIASALVRFWEIRGFVQEGLGWFERLLAQTDEGISPVVRVNALVFASFLAMFLGNASATMAYGTKAVDIAEGISDEDDPVVTFALIGLASGARAAGDYHTAFTIGEQVLKHLRVSPKSSFNLGMALLSQGENAIQLGSYDLARERLDESLKLARQDGDAFRIAHTFNALGDLSRLEQNYIEAASAYENGVTLLRKLEAQHDLASILCNLGYACLHLEDIEHARSLFSESMSIHQTQQNKPGMTECLIGCAATAVMGGLPACGARLLSAAVAISGQPSASIWKATQMEFEHHLDLVRAKLTQAEFQAEQTVGSVLSLEQAVDYAHRYALIPGIASAMAHSPTESPTNLSKRETEVAALIGQGKTNGKIATELFLSKRTVETHVSKILSKLDFTSRAQIMRWAIDHGLTQTSA